MLLSAVNRITRRETNKICLLSGCFYLGVGHVGTEHRTQFPLPMNYDHARIRSVFQGLFGHSHSSWHNVSVHGDSRPYKRHIFCLIRFFQEGRLQYEMCVLGVREQTNFEGGLVSKCIPILKGPSANFIPKIWCNIKLKLNLLLRIFTIPFL